MSKAGLLTTGFLTVALIMAANDDLNAQNKAMAFNGAANTEVSINNTPVILEGNGGEAQTLSGKNSALVIYLSGGEAEEKYTAEQYAKMLQVMFKDDKRTSFPANVSVVYQESGKERPTVGSVFINGRRYDKNGGEYAKGDGVLTPSQMVQLIPTITSDYATKNGLASLDTQTSVQVAASGYDR